MPPQPWTTPEQHDFLVREDAKWKFIKSGDTTLANFYLRTANEFLVKWPAIPDEAMLEKAKGDEAEAARLARDSMAKRISWWFINRHRHKKSTPVAPPPLLDLAGKNSRKRPPLQKWQAFSSVYYRPKDSPLRVEVRSLFNRRHDPEAVGFLAGFLPPDADISTTDYLTFLGAFARARCTDLSTDEEERVNTYIKEQQQLVADHQDHPWFLDDDFEDKPLLAENRYIQQRIDELPRVAQRALEEIEKATGFKAFLLVGGPTPAENGAIITHIHTSGTALATGLTFTESWSEAAALSTAYGEWLQFAYSDEEKSRRQGYSASSLTSPHEPTSFNNLAPATPDGPSPTIPNASPATPTEQTPATPTEQAPATPTEQTPATLNSDGREDPVLGVLSTPPVTPHSTPTTLSPSPSPQVFHSFERDPSHPEFITTSIIEGLNSVDGGPCWVEMMRSYLRLESQYRSRRVGKLSLQHRPGEVVTWGHQRTCLPSILNVPRFRQQWVSWWGSCQPKWRNTETWPYPRCDAKEKDWSRLNVTGSHGLFPVVVSTSWWVGILDEDSHGVFDAIVEDLHWVIENLIYFNSKSQVPRHQPNVAVGLQFLGHHNRDPSKRQIKPSLKVRENN